MITKSYKKLRMENQIYNLYNEEAYIIDMRKNNQEAYNEGYKINTSVVLKDFEDYLPDNYTNLVIIKEDDSKEDDSMDIVKLFKNTCRIDNQIVLKLYKQFPILFDGSNKIYPSLIIPLYPKRVFLGSIRTVTSDFLKSCGIDIIINMTYSKLSCVDPIKIIEYHYPIEDSEYQDIGDILLETYDLLDVNDNILVVCEKGQSRSVSVVLYYYSKKFNVSMSEGLKKLKECRSICKPNPSFIKQIDEMLKK